MNRHVFYATCLQSAAGAASSADTTVAMVRGAASRHENTTGNGGILGCICYVRTYPTLKNLSSLDSERNTVLTACLGSRNAARHNRHTHHSARRGLASGNGYPAGLHNLSLFFIAHKFQRVQAGVLCEGRTGEHGRPRYVQRVRVPHGHDVSQWIFIG